MKTTVKADSKRIAVVCPCKLDKQKITIFVGNGNYGSYANLDIHGAVVLGQALIDLAQKSEDEKLCPAALTSGIDWQQVNAIARGDA